jgi:hypothetical protein
VGEGKETLAYGSVAAAFLPEGTQGSHCPQPPVGWTCPPVATGSVFHPKTLRLASVEMPRNRLSKGNDLIEGAMI